MSKRTKMSRLVKELSRTIEKAESSGVAQDIVESMSSVRDMLQRKDDFTELACNDHSVTCEKIMAETYQRDWQADYDQGKTPWSFSPGMLCGRVEGQFLKSLVSIHKAKRVLEVGMFTGYSALTMAEALPADGEVVTLDICESLKSLVKDLTKDSPHAKKIRIEIGPGLDTMAKLADKGEQFDIMFFDGEKKDYIPLLEMAFDRNLLSPGGTVLIDNAYVIGSAYRTADNNTQAHKIVETLKSRPELHRVLLPVSDGVLMIRRLKDVEGATA